MPDEDDTDGKGYLDRRQGERQQRTDRRGRTRTAGIGAGGGRVTVAGVEKKVGTSDPVYLAGVE